MNRDIGRYFAYLSPLLAFSCQHSETQSLDDVLPDHPNVLLIVSDDQGYGDFGFTSGGRAITPNLDRLAAESARFDNYMVCPASSPTRATLYTGRFYLETGVWVVPPRANLRDDETVMPTFFKNAGYKTMLSGKPDTAVPFGHALTEFWDEHHRGCSKFPDMVGQISSDPSISSIRAQLETETGGYIKYNPDEGFHTDVITDQALSFIKKNKDQKWLLSLNFISPHLPWVCDRKYSDLYTRNGFSSRLATCWGEVTQMDDCIGKVLSLLDELGLAGNTVVVFMSDNGPTNELQGKVKPHDGLHFNGDEWAERNSASLRGYKALCFDGGIRVPLLVRWPGHVLPGLRHQLVSVEDILPTLLKLSGISPDKTPHLPFTGTDFSDCLFTLSSPSQRQSLFRVDLAFQGSPQTQGGIIPDPIHIPFEKVHTTLRGDRYKFHGFEDGTTALFDIQADPRELNDVSASHPELVAEMETQSRARWKQILSTGRAYAMPPLTIGKVPYGQEVFTQVSCNPCHAREFSGSVKIIGQSVYGFSKPDASASYQLDIRQSGRYQVVLVGNKMHLCLPLEIYVGNTLYKASSISNHEVVFPAVFLTGSDKKMTIRAASAGTGTASDCQLMKIQFKKLT